MTRRDAPQVQVATQGLSTSRVRVHGRAPACGEEEPQESTLIASTTVGVLEGGIGFSLGVLVTVVAVQAIEFMKIPKGLDELDQPRAMKPPTVVPHGRVDRTVPKDLFNTGVRRALDIAKEHKAKP